MMHGPVEGLKFHYTFKEFVEVICSQVPGSSNAFCHSAGEQLLMDLILSCIVVPIPLLIPGPFRSHPPTHITALMKRKAFLPRCVGFI